MRICDGPTSPPASVVLPGSVLLSDRLCNCTLCSLLNSHVGDGDTDLDDVAAGGRDRAGQGRGSGVEGEQGEAERRREQRARILPADRRGGRARQEPADLAKTDE